MRFESVIVVLADHQQAVVLPGHLFCAADKRVVKRVGDGGDDRPHQVAALRAGDLRQPGGLVGQHPCSQPLAGEQQPFGLQPLVGAAHRVQVDAQVARQEAHRRQPVTGLQPARGHQPDELLLELQDERQIELRVYG